MVLEEVVTIGTDSQHEGGEAQNSWREYPKGH